MRHSLRPMAAAVLGGALALSVPAAAKDLVVIEGPVTAGSFNCKGCVEREALKDKAVSTKKIKDDSVTRNKIDDGAVGTGKIRDAAVTVEKLGQDVLDMLAPSQSNFYITLDGNGAEATIATNGPLRYFARCLLDVEGDEIQIVATSSDFGWFEEGASDNFFGSQPFGANEEVVVQYQGIYPSGGKLYDNLDETSIVAPDGSYLALEGDAGGLGLNIFDAGCIVVGTSYSITGDVVIRDGEP